MSCNPVISVIMPCYNAAETISKTIHSVYSQSFTDFELIVVNDGSSDESLATLHKLTEKYPSLQVIDQNNSGAATARNRGLAHARGKFIAFLDADDSWHPDFLFKLYEALDKDQGAAIAYCGWQNIGLAQNRCKPYTPPDYETPNKIELFLRACPWPIHAALTRKKYIDAVNGFNETLTSCMDYDLWLRIASFNKIVLVPEVLAFYHHHAGEQITKNRLKIAMNHWRVQNEFLNENQAIANQLGRNKIADIVQGELKQRAYVSYWQRDLTTAHFIFRKLLFELYFKFSDLKYMLPSLLPLNLYKYIIYKLDQ